MTFILFALVLLCGVQIGVIIGVGLCFHAWAKRQPDEPDYSGGL